MNKNINQTLNALVPILNMNGENVESIEAVRNWFQGIGQGHFKEVAEITYKNGYRKYADIGCDSNLTAIYDIMAVLQNLKQPSGGINIIERDVYEH